MWSNDLSFGVHVQRDPRMVSVVRRLVERNLERVGDPAARSRLSMAAHELLENAAKYGVSDHSDLDVQIIAEHQQALVRLRNQSTPAHIARLRERIEQLRGARNPSAFYEQLMRDSFDTGDDESGLGLARICVEGELELALEVEGDTVTIMASSQPTRTRDVD